MSRQEGARSAWGQAWRFKLDLWNPFGRRVPTPQSWPSHPTHKKRRYSHMTQHTCGGKSEDTSWEWNPGTESGHHPCMLYLQSHLGGASFLIFWHMLILCPGIVYIPAHIWHVPWNWWYLTWSYSILAPCLRPSNYNLLSGLFSKFVFTHERTCNIVLSESWLLLNIISSSQFILLQVMDNTPLSVYEMFSLVIYLVIYLLPRLTSAAS